MSDSNPYAVTASADSLLDALVEPDALVVESQIKADYLLERIPKYQQACRQAMLIYRDAQMSLFWRFKLVAIVLGIVLIGIWLNSLAANPTHVWMFLLATGIVIAIYVLQNYYGPVIVVKLVPRRIRRLARQAPYSSNAILRPKGFALKDFRWRHPSIKWSRLAFAFAADDFVIFVLKGLDPEFLLVGSNDDLLAVLNYLKCVGVDLKFAEDFEPRQNIGHAEGLPENN